MYQFLNRMPRQLKWTILLALDVSLAPIALFAAYALQNNNISLSNMPLLNLQAAMLLMAISGLLAVGTNIYKVQLKAYETRAIGLSAIHAILLGVAALALDDLANYDTPLAMFITFMLMFFLLAVSIRILMLQLLLFIYRSGTAQVRVLIYGAGPTGRQLAAALRTDETIYPIAFIDDNQTLQGSIVQGLKVYPFKSVSVLQKTRHVNRVLLAMPSVQRSRLVQISRSLEDKGLDVQSLPSFTQMAHGQTLLDQLESIVPGQFLGRAPLDAELSGGGATYAGRVVLISGAGGSIGSELCRQVLASSPAKLVLLEISELALYTINLELEALTEKKPVPIVPVLGSVLDGALMQQVFTDQGVQVVLHAAAYKHVNLVEKNPIIGASNNVLGTQTLAQMAADVGVERFILISSDKAVRPTNVMGASKRLAEIVVQDMAHRAASMGQGCTVFSMVRFGNVIGSSGSVIPLFQNQIRKGGPVTLTHREVTRYFMTISEAARLVLLAGSFACGGEVFVLDMGAPVPIYDLARQMIEAAGYRLRDADHPNGDIEIVLTGLSPGEKVHEELLIGGKRLTTLHPKIMQAQEAHLSETEAAALLKGLRAAITDHDVGALRSIIAHWVEGAAHFVSAPQLIPPVNRLQLVVGNPNKPTNL